MQPEKEKRRKRRKEGAILLSSDARSPRTRPWTRRRRTEDAAGEPIEPPEQPP